MNITDAPSPNFSPRKDGKTPRLIVLHYTDTQTLAETLALLQNPAREASAHYVVDADGAILRLVDEKSRAWHAGASCWEGETDVNSASVGIEIQNGGHAHGPTPFPTVQIRAVMELCKDIAARHNIKPHHIIGHSDIAPARKIDPGHLFPWQALAAEGLGLWPAVTAADRVILSEDEIKARLVRYGYDASIDFPLLMTAFQRHFHPETFTAFDAHAPYNAETIARLCALTRMKDNAHD